MNRIPFVAFAVLALLLAAAGFIGSTDKPPPHESPATEASPPLARKTPVLVDSEVLEQRARESALIDEAIVSTTTTTQVTTTTTTTTTTTPPTTTTTSTPSTSATTTPEPTSTTQPPTTTTTTQAGGFLSGAESEFAAQINSYRGSSGLSSLSQSGSLDAYARSWAEQMAANGSLSHSNVGSLLGEWSAVGENVGVGSSVGGLFGAFVDSPEHESNISGDFTHMGIGVYQDSDGALWTTHVFAR